MRPVHVVSFAAVLALGASAAQTASASQAHKGADGGNGLPNGVPGCAGGTDPAADGKFYVPGTKRPCNPGKQDRAKVR